MSSEIIKLMFYQHCHDKNYHHDIYVLSRKDRLNHLIHHLHKYNNASIKPVNWLEDMLACILSMAGTMNIHLDRKLSAKLLKPISDVSDITKLFDDSILTNQLTDTLRSLSKSMESLDHVESFDYNTTIVDSIVLLTVIVFQLNYVERNYKIMEKANFDLVKRYLERLESIKTKHCFHEYHEENISKNFSGYKLLRDKFLLSDTKVVVLS